MIKRKNITSYEINTISHKLKNGLSKRQIALYLKVDIKRVEYIIRKVMKQKEEKIQIAIVISKKSLSEEDISSFKEDISLKEGDVVFVLTGNSRDYKKLSEELKTLNREHYFHPPDWKKHQKQAFNVNKKWISDNCSSVYFI